MAHEPYNNSWPLHKAIEDDNLEDLESLLRTPYLDLNMQDDCGRTPLFLSLEQRRSSSFVMGLIEAGCDVKISDQNEVTPLHWAITLSLHEIAQELLKRGADINAQQEPIYGRGLRWFMEGELVEKKTPLHFAVAVGNLEGVCMLLYYGADVCITCRISKSGNNITPLKYAAYYKLQDMVKILINYYDNSYYTHQNQLDQFNLRSWLDLEHEGTSLLVYSFGYESAECAKLFWNKIDFESILDEHDLISVLAAHIKHSSFCPCEWVEYLYLLLNFFFKHQLCISYKPVHGFYYTDTFFYNLFIAFHRKDIQRTTRLGIINTCLSLGAPIHVNDLQKLHELYGFGEELEVLIYADRYYERAPLSFISFVLGLEEDISSELISELFDSYFCKEPWSQFWEFNSLRIPADYFVRLLGFFSLPAIAKQEIKNNCDYISADKQQQIFKKLDEMPEFPTLLELSRNEARKYVIWTNKINCPYHFHDAVKKLNCPILIKDLIRFKTPLY